MKTELIDLKSRGCLNKPIPEGIDLQEEISRLKKEKNAIILSHYYQNREI